MKERKQDTEQNITLFCEKPISWINGVKEANLFITLDNFLVLFQSLEKVGKRSFHVVQVTGHLLLLQQGLV